MAGIYLHIPFCKQACHYCNFHFSTSMRLKSAMIKAIQQEIVLRKDYLNNAPLQSIYFGGGTPSLLSGDEIQDLLHTISKNQTILSDAEITLEANPDDLSLKKCEEIKSAGINRLSLGIQSFHDRDLQFMNRAHDSADALHVMEIIRKAGFENYTIDLIYGTPTMSNDRWNANIEQALAFGVPHLSCYCLTIEPRTALARFIEAGKAPSPDDEQSERQFKILVEKLTSEGYDHYEISNFCKPSYHAVHNSSYWEGNHYLGAGPAAHSYNGNSRQWNVANNSRYIKALESGTPFYESEKLSQIDQLNEYLMTGLRTKHGIEKNIIKTAFPDQEKMLTQNLLSQVKKENILETDDRWKLTSKAKFIADTIISDLFLIEE